MRGQKACRTQHKQHNCCRLQQRHVGQYLRREDTLILYGQHLSQLQSSSSHAAQSISQPLCVFVCQVCIEALLLGLFSGGEEVADLQSQVCLCCSHGVQDWTEENLLCAHSYPFLNYNTPCTSTPWALVQAGFVVQNWMAVCVPWSQHNDVCSMDVIQDYMLWLC